MTTKTGLTLAAALFAASAGFANAQTAPAADPHHPAGQPPAGAMPGGPGQPGGMGASGGQGMMMGGDMAKMMSMMQMMHGGMMPVGAGPGAMRPLERIEGQLAFFRTELKITDAQTPRWNAFAETIRGAATRLRQAMEAKPAATAPEQLERRTAMLTAQLDAMRAVQTTAKPLYDALSDEQKKTADELMAQHFVAMRAGGM